MINYSTKDLSIDNFSPHLFWDVDKGNIELDNDWRYIIKKVLIYGLLSDFKLINKIYGVDKIAETAIEIRELEKKHFRL